jgi:hypothetical protein
MELDDLKKGWKERTTEHSKLNSKNMAQLELILKQKTSGMLNKVKNRYGKLISYMLVGVFFTMIVIGFIPWLTGQDVPVYTFPTTLDRALNMLVSLSLGMTFVFFYWLKYTAMETEFDGEDIKQAVKQNIGKLKRSLRHEVMFVIALFFGWLTIARFHSQVAGHGYFWDIFHLDILLAIGALAVLLGIYLIVRYNLYRKYMAELKGYLDEFEKV